MCGGAQIALSVRTNCTSRGAKLASVAAHKSLRSAMRSKRESRIVQSFE